MVYSVWRPTHHLYDYYQDAQGISDEGPKPAVHSNNKIGNAPSEISWKLPTNAKKVGTGSKAKGIVIHLNNELSKIPCFVWPIAGYVLYRIIRG